MIRTVILTVLLTITAAFPQFSQKKDVVIPHPEEISYEEAMEILIAFDSLYHIDSCSIFDITPDSCYHFFATYRTLLSDTSEILTDTAAFVRTANTYKELTHTRLSENERAQLSHDVLITFIEEKKETRDVSFLAPWMEKVYHWYVKNISEPIRDFIYNMKQKIGKGSSFLFAAIGFAALIILGVLLARILPRYIAIGPSTEMKALNDARLRMKELSLDEIIVDAEKYLNEYDIQECTRYLYIAILKWLEAVRSVKPFQWWTNKQLLRLLKRKNEVRLSEIEQLFHMYEEVSFGHKVISKSELKKMYENTLLIVMEAK